MIYDLRAYRITRKIAESKHNAQLKAKSRRDGESNVTPRV